MTGDPGRRTRRSLLALGGAAVAVASGLPGGGVPPCTHSGGVRASGDARFARWLYAPRAVFDADHYFLFSLRVDDVRRYADAMADPAARRYRAYLPGLLFEELRAVAADVDRLLVTYPLGTAPATGLVLWGRYDPGAIGRRLRRHGYRRAGTVHDHALYRTGDTGRAVAVGRRTLVQGTDAPVADAGAVVRASLDARYGDGATYRAVSPDLDALLERVGTGSDVSGYTHERVVDGDPARGVFAGAVGRAHGYRFGCERTRSRFAFLFADAASPAAVGEWVRAQSASGERFARADSVVVRRRGRAVVVDATIPTRALA